MDHRDPHELIKQLDLTPHPEGGFYRETVRTSNGHDGRSQMTAILFLLLQGQHSHWHKVDADELWLWHAGSPLSLSLESEEIITLGGDFSRGHQLQSLVPAGKWQSAISNHGWALMSCIVSPGFEFSGFEMAPADWKPAEFADG